MDPNKGVYGIILASGESRRMGKPKLLLPWGSIPILEHILTKLKDVPFSGTAIVIPENSHDLQHLIAPYSYHVILNRNPSLGMGHSLSLAVASLPDSAEAAVFLLGDQPKIQEEDIRKVITVFNQIKMKQGDCPKVIIQTKYRNNQEGHPILFSRHFFKELSALNGDKGGREIIRKNDGFLLHCFTENEYPKDIDTPSDYMQLLRE